MSAFDPLRTLGTSQISGPMGVPQINLETLLGSLDLEEDKA